MPLDGKYIAVGNQSVYDVCLNTYGTANLLSKFMADNGLTNYSYRPYAGQELLYDKSLVIDIPVKNINKIYATGDYNIFYPIPTDILDGYPATAIAFSMSRRLYIAYEGNAFRARRGSDNAEQDFGFDSDGNVVAADLTTFAGGSTLYLVTGYDQGALGNDATQSTAAQQLLIYIDKVNNNISVGVNAWKIANSQYMLTSNITPASTFYMFTAHGSSATTAQGQIYGRNGAATGPYFWTLRNGANDRQQAAMTNALINRLDVTGLPKDRYNSVSEVYDANNGALNWRVTEGAQTNEITQGSIPTDIDMILAGSFAGANLTYFYTAELIIFADVDISPAGVTALTADIDTYYGF